MKSKKPWIAEGDQQLVAQLVIGAIVVLWFIITQGVMPCDVKFCGA